MNDWDAQSIVLIIGALSTMIVTVIAAVVAAVASMRSSARAESTEKKADGLIAKTAEIHTLANSNLSKVTGALQVANEKIQGLEKLMATLVESKREAALVAAEAVKSSPHEPRMLLTDAADAADAAVKASLHSIDENTAETAANTARADAATARTEAIVKDAL